MRKKKILTALALTAAIATPLALPATASAHETVRVKRVTVTVSSDGHGHVVRRREVVRRWAPPRRHPHYRAHGYGYHRLMPHYDYRGYRQYRRAVEYKPRQGAHAQPRSVVSHQQRLQRNLHKGPQGEVRNRRSGHSVETSAKSGSQTNHVLFSHRSAKHS